MQQHAQNGWYCPYFGQQQENLTDTQKQELAAYQQQMIESKSQMLQKEVEWGRITQVQGSMMKNKMPDLFILPPFL